MKNILFLIVILLATNVATASECTSIRDEDKRRECLAVERQDPNDCTSIRNSDDRTLCRQRAGQRPLYRERY
jgi:hypothetical protein